MYTNNLHPLLHTRMLLVDAPYQLVLNEQGWISSGADGFWAFDTRILSTLRLHTNGSLEFIGTISSTADSATFLHSLRGIGEPTPDPAVLVWHTVDLTSGELHVSWRMQNVGELTHQVELACRIASDAAGMDDVRAARSTATISVPCTLYATTHAVGSELQMCVTGRGLTSEPRVITLQPGDSYECAVSITVHRESAPLFTHRERTTSLELRIQPEGTPFAQAVHRSLGDLRALLLRDPLTGGHFAAAGSPWYLTLFGRDSIWAARLSLVVCPSLAIETLETLARRQATECDPMTCAEPGKILHEVRASTSHLDGGLTVPPLYYGSVDSTALWVLLFIECWRARFATDRLEALVPALTRATGWILTSLARDALGFLRYVNETGVGLTNQGWKDSSDGVRNGDGSRVQPPIALCEVQGYAYQALRGVAELTGDLGHTWTKAGGQHPDMLFTQAHALQSRFRKRFWVEDARGRYPANALASDGIPATARASNMGHLLGTGMITHTEARLIADALMADDLNSGYGLRTLSSDVPGYNVVGYHTGSVWAHDTIIAARGLEAEGFLEEADRLATGILLATEHFGYRIPELHGGNPFYPGGAPLPYPAACRPQAWSAAAILDAARLLFRVTVSGCPSTAPAAPAVWGHRAEGFWNNSTRHYVNVSPTGQRTTGKAPPV